jgi:hypothetical protein
VMRTAFLKDAAFPEKNVHFFFLHITSFVRNGAFYTLTQVSEPQRRISKEVMC